MGRPLSHARRPGSSPLARGLPHNWGHPSGYPRIIPARAGFTACVGARVRASGDHPRSRGVYRRRLRRRLRGQGSSPLARGLPEPPDHVPLGPGIIPARAGFTAIVIVVIVVSSDHPRSRGVYRRVSPARARRAGSSPLARGLLPRPLTAIRTGGIIPARAGFTRRLRWSLWFLSDHPRSRGVYAGEFYPCAPDVGSSPLARGLLWVDTTARTADRIIPARAGFTARDRTALLPPPDHPRSRGVYPASASSSPPTSWIIPARAGFTPPPRTPTPPAPDHPRSRGVYVSAAGRRPRSAGSSPLARGLRDHADVADAALGIIPARAGFTPGYTPGRDVYQDHPRSRGVY